MCTCACVRESGCVRVAECPFHVYPPFFGTGWRRPKGCLELQVIFRKRATNYKARLQKMNCKNMASYGTLPPCTIYVSVCVFVYVRVCVRERAWMCTCGRVPLSRLSTLFWYHLREYVCVRVCVLVCVYVRMDVYMWLGATLMFIQPFWGLCA